MKYASLDKMISIVAAAFEGVHDKGGVPYIMHCLTVMDGVKHLGYKAMMIGVGHDLLEDTDWTVQRLLDAGFHPDVVYGIVSVTHLPKHSYDEYVEGIPLRWIPIKLSDLCHNMDITRLKDTRPKDFERLVKYAKAYKYLEAKLNG